MQRANSLEQPWFWERLKAGGEGDDRGWDCWMASPTWWTWISASSRRWWRTGNPGVLQSMGSQIVRHEWLNNSKKVWGISIIQAKNDSSLILGNRSEVFPCCSVEKNLPAMQEMFVWSPGQEDPLEEGMSTHSSILARKIPWTEEPCGPQSLGLQKSDMIWQLNHHYHHWSSSQKDFLIDVGWKWETRYATSWDRECCNWSRFGDEGRARAQL